MISGGGRSAIAVIPSVGSGRYAPGPSIALPSLFECWSPNDTIQYRLLEGHHKTRQRCYRVQYYRLKPEPEIPVRGYPETFLHCRNEIKQPPCGNETRGDRRERVGSA